MKNYLGFTLAVFAVILYFRNNFYSAPTKQIKQSSKKTISLNKILVLGDSITEGYGLPSEKAYPSLLQKK